MKNLKSILAVVIVLVIGVCLTGCQTAEEKAYGEWVYSLDYIPGMLMLDFTDKAKAELVDEGSLEAAKSSDISVVYGNWELLYFADKNDVPIPGFVSATVRIGDSEYTSQDYVVSLNGNISDNETEITGVMGIAINIPELTDIVTVEQGKAFSLESAGIDSLTITFKDSNGELITVAR